MSAKRAGRKPVNLPLDLNRLRTLLASNPIAKSVLEFTARAQPQHLAELSTVDNLEKSLKDGSGLKWQRRRLVRALRELALVGCGHLRLGRHGSPSRFKWTVAPGELLKRPEPGSGAAPVPPRPEARPALDSRFLEHLFHLRRDQDVTLRLPKDLTEKEADRLARFITTLPFG